MFGYGEIKKKLDEIIHLQYEHANLMMQYLGLLEQLKKGHKKVMSDLTELKAQVAETRNAEQAALKLIHGLVEQLVAAQDDPEEIKAIIEELRQSEDALSAAVVANTPAPPPGTTPAVGDPIENVVTPARFLPETSARDYPETRATEAEKIEAERLAREYPEPPPEKFRPE